jgi:hypothetical protein
MVGSCYEEKKMFRVVPFHYVIFDEAHMLKNMNTQRYENLITINVSTGVDMQFNDSRDAVLCWGQMLDRGVVPCIVFILEFLVYLINLNPYVRYLSAFTRTEC